MWILLCCCGDGDACDPDNGCVFVDGYGVNYTTGTIRINTSTSTVRMNIPHTTTVNIITRTNTAIFTPTTINIIKIIYNAIKILLLIVVEMLKVVLVLVLILTVGVQAVFLWTVV